MHLAPRCVLTGMGQGWVLIRAYMKFTWAGVTRWAGRSQVDVVSSTRETCDTITFTLAGVIIGSITILWHCFICIDARSAEAELRVLNNVV